ncbi:hypothetical protein SEA_JUMBO_50 [Gordonia phage Jumbo]|uniref:Uncharacterized protein n=1 Tax=Gordonia phage Jumbo TaxID=1887650 RepID=A0A1B3B0K4_9CAUD|nr:hypothetical protein BIZ69_gp050 [Gordonia phage Jumbo]AOE44560.1 hypothetical protein SEA_JUMBO_50 [Gordonia phage Jumbo]
MSNPHRNSVPEWLIHNPFIKEDAVNTEPISLPLEDQIPTEQFEPAEPIQDFSYKFGYWFTMVIIILISAAIAVCLLALAAGLVAGFVNVFL